MSTKSRPAEERQRRLQAALSATQTQQMELQAQLGDLQRLKREHGSAEVSPLSPSLSHNSSLGCWSVECMPHIDTMWGAEVGSRAFALCVEVRNELGALVLNVMNRVECAVA